MKENLHLILNEAERVEKNIGRPYASAHEAYGVLAEEVDELWDEIKKKNPNPELLKNEAIQIAAVCLRLISQL